ncbi:superoxide dismutase family protein [bacterium]|nr:superoxide dismutase family protein [bacterium]
MPSNDYLSFIARNAPNAFALLKGSDAYPALRARVEFYQTNKGVLVLTEAYNLPDKENKGFGAFAFHIHSGESCTKYGDDPFAGAEGHFNPTDALHPYHAGDLPPLFSNNGYATPVAILTSPHIVLFPELVILALTNNKSPELTVVPELSVYVCSPVPLVVMV